MFTRPYKGYTNNAGALLGTTPPQTHLRADHYDTFRRFDAIMASTLIEVLSLLPDTYDDKQNNALTIREIELIARSFPETKFSGYWVREGRSDERITIEMIWVPTIHQSLRFQLLNTFLKDRSDDSDCVPLSDGEYRWYWWD